MEVENLGDRNVIRLNQGKEEYFAGTGKATGGA